MLPLDPDAPALVQLLRGLETEALAELGGILHVEELPDGAAVFAEGDDGKALYLVLDGEAVVEKRVNDDGASSTIHVLGSGDVFGEMAFVDRRPRSATVRARGRLRMLRLDADDFRALSASSPDVALHVMTTLLAVASSRLRAANDCLVRLHETGRLLGATHDATEISHIVLDQVRRSIPVIDGGVVALYDGAPGGCVPVVGFGLPATMPVPFPLDPHGPLVAAISSRTDALCVGPADPLAPLVRFFGRRWCLLTNLERDGRLLGLIAVCSNATVNPFDASHQVILGIVADQAAPRYR